MPSRGLTVMAKALKKGGIAIFPIDEKLLDPKTDKGTGYGLAIAKLTKDGVWAPLDKREFIYKKRLDAKHSDKKSSKLMIFEKL